MKTLRKIKLAPILSLITTVTVTNAAYVYGIENGYFYDDKTIQFGDYYNAVYIYNDTTVDMTGGVVVLNVEAHDTSTFNISGGEVGQTVLSLDSSTVNIHDGLLAGLQTEGSSFANLKGGIISDIVGCYDESVLNIFGGEINGFLYVWSGVERSKCIVNIFGYGFAYDPLGGKSNGGQITGYWVDNIAFSIDFMDSGPTYFLRSTYYNNVYLHEIPEPCTLFLMGAGGLAMIRKYRR